MSDLETEAEKVSKACPGLTPEEARGIAARLVLTMDASKRVTDFRPEQIPKLIKIAGEMQRSWFKEMQGRLFFPFYSENGKGAIALKDLPALDYSKGAKPRIEQLQDALGEDAAISECFLSQ